MVLASISLFDMVNMLPSVIGGRLPFLSGGSYHSTVGRGSPCTKQISFPGESFQVHAVEAISGSKAGLSVIIIYSFHIE